MMHCSENPGRTRSVIARKRKRIAAGGKPRVLDLFSGCGGLSLGFFSAGCEIRAAIEIDPYAAQSHGINFPGSGLPHGQPRDVTLTDPATLTGDLGFGDPVDAFDVLVGGPPCQAFARVGRSKLREVADHPEAFRHDPRSRLYLDYMKYVEACLPLAVVLENVPDMLNFGSHNIAHEVCDVLSRRGYSCGYTLLNAAHYGVPQMRERVFLIALRQEVADHVVFPAPTHSIDLPPGYESTRAVALKHLKARKDPPSDEFWIPGSEPATASDLPPAVTARQALHDLPVIDARKEMAAGRLRRGARRFNSGVPYAPVATLTDYARSMREWPGFEAPDRIMDHVIRYLPRDYGLFSRMNPGDQYPEAHLHAENMFKEELEDRRRKGRPVREGSEVWTTLRRELVPPYDHEKFPNKWRKLEPDKPARTLMAHLEKDSYSHIHYDSAQARTISVREAARLQSFPDGFVFRGTMNPAFRQIGNAVPPLLARAIGSTLLRQIVAGRQQPPRLFAAAS